MAMAKKKQVQVTTVSQWKKKNLNERNLELPSGAIFKVKDVDLQTMAIRGYLPLELMNSLTSAGLKIKNNTIEGKAELDGIKDNDITGIDELARQFIVAAVISPKLSLEDFSDTVNVYDLEFPDVMFIFNNCIRGGAMKFAPFFQEGASSNTITPDSGNISSKAIGDNGDTRSKGKV